MSYIANGHAIICRTNLSNDEIELLDKVHFTEDKTGYFFKYTDKEKTQGRMTWVNNTNLFSSENYIDFFRMNEYFVFMVSSPKFIKYFKTIIKSRFKKDDVVEIIKFPLSGNIKNYDSEIRNIVAEVYNIEGDFYFETDIMGVKFNIHRDNKNSIIKYFVNGEISMGMGHSFDEWKEYMFNLIELDKRVSELEIQ